MKPIPSHVAQCKSMLPHFPLTPRTCVMSSIQLSDEFQSAANRLRSSEESLVMKSIKAQVHSMQVTDR